MSYPGTRDFKIRVEAWNKKTKQGKSLFKIKVHSFFYIHKHTLAPSSHLVMRHAPPPAEWFIFHLIWTLEVELNPWKDYWLSPQKNSISLTADVSERLQPFPSMLYLNRGSKMTGAKWLDDRHLLPDVLMSRFLVSYREETWGRHLLTCSVPEVHD